MSFNLSAILRLNTQGFTQPLAGAQSGLQTLRSGLTRLAAPLAAAAGGFLSARTAIRGFNDALDTGGRLEHLRAQTGETVKDLAILEQALKDNGAGAGMAGKAINTLQRAISGVNEDGQSTGPVLQRLGLTLDGLRRLSPVQQMQSIAAGLRAIEDPADRAAVAMRLFGQAGGQLMAFLGDPNALGSAAQVLGKQAELLEQNSQKFERASTLLSNVGVKFRGFFVGLAAETINPLLEALEGFNRIDLAPLGQQVGRIVLLLRNAFSDGTLAEMVSLSLRVGFQRGLDYLTRGLTATFTGALQFLSGTALTYWEAMGDVARGAFQKLGGALLDIFMTPITYVQAAIDGIVQDLYYSADRVLGWFGRTNNAAKPQTFEQNLADRMDPTKPGFFLRDAAGVAQAQGNESIANGMTKLAQVMAEMEPALRAGWEAGGEMFGDLGEAGQRLAELFDPLRKAMDEMSASLGTATSRQEEHTQAVSRSRREVETDQITRLGGRIRDLVNLGGNALQAHRHRGVPTSTGGPLPSLGERASTTVGPAGGPALDFARRTAENTAQIASLLRRGLSTTTPSTEAQWA